MAMGAHHMLDAAEALSMASPWCFPLSASCMCVCVFGLTFWRAPLLELGPLAWHE